jgi:hypothetical protein
MRLLNEDNIQAFALRIWGRPEKTPIKRVEIQHTFKLCTSTSIAFYDCTNR